MRFAVLAVLLVLARPAAADGSESDERSPGAAVALSLVPTLGGIALTAWGSTLDERGDGEEIVVGTGLVIANLGPTFGNVYARDVWNIGLQSRLVGVGVGVIGFVITIRARCYFGFECKNEDLGTLGRVTIGAGALAYVGGAAIEIWNAHRAATEHNAATRRASIALVPVLRPDGGGLALGGSF